MSNHDGTAPKESVLATFDALDELFQDIASGGAAAACEAYDTLFGPRALHADLEALAGRRDEFMRRFRGATYIIATHPAKSGHEALSMFADRVFRMARGRRSWIPRARAALDAARLANVEADTTQQQIDLERAGSDFVNAMLLALGGWAEHGLSIRRDIQGEIYWEPGNLTTAEQKPSNHATQVAARQLSAASVARSPQALAQGMFVKVGSDYWEVGLGGVRKTVRDSKGMGYLHQLLSAPNQPIHAWTLLNGTDPPPVSTEAVVDDETIDRVRRELTELVALSAEEANLEKREDLDRDIAKLREYLGSSQAGVGKDRRPRPVRDQHEKAREAVGWAMRSALARIGEEHAALHAHLHEAIENPSGMRPCYRPLGDVPAWILHADRHEREA